VIIDRGFEIPAGSKCLGEKCMVITASDKDRVDITDTGTKIIRSGLNNEGLFNWNEIIKILGGMGLHSVLAEGGSAIISSLLKASIADKIVLFIAPKLLGSGIQLVSWDKTSSIDDALGLMIEDLQTIGGDIMIEARIKEK
jgi:diaminohydroxyphosphoribosylaminopyrimidine deaminase/5-amino-6-(5-phosphoribosylamino)uracil reductase